MTEKVEKEKDKLCMRSGFDHSIASVVCCGTKTNNELSSLISNIVALALTQSHWLQVEVLCQILSIQLLPAGPFTFSFFFLSTHAALQGFRPLNLAWHLHLEFAHWTLSLVRPTTWVRPQDALTPEVS
jgi:hypothetical protein